MSRLFACFTPVLTLWITACGPSSADIVASQQDAFGALASLDEREQTWREALDAFAQGRRSTSADACELHLVDDLGLQAGDLDFVRGDEIEDLGSTALAEAGASLRVVLAELLTADGVTDDHIGRLAQQTQVATATLGVEAVWLVQELGYPSWSTTAGLTPGVFRGVLLVYDHDTESALCAAEVRETNAPNVLPERDAPERAAFDEAPEQFLLADLHTQAFLAAVDAFHQVTAP